MDPIKDLIITNNLNAIIDLIESGHLDINQQKWGHVMPLHCAIQHNRPQIVEYLIDHGAGINVLDGSGDTALDVAIDAKNLDMIKYLVSCGAVFDQNMDGRLTHTILHRVLNLGFDGRYPNYVGNGNELDIVKYVVELGVPIDKQDQYAHTALWYAVRHKQLDIVKYLVSCGADVHCRTSTNYTLLHEAARYGHMEIVQYLLSHGIDKNIRGNIDKNTAEMLAMYRHHREVAEYIDSYVYVDPVPVKGVHDIDDLIIL